MWRTNDARRRRWQRSRTHRRFRQENSSSSRGSWGFGAYGDIVVKSDGRKGVVAVGVLRVDEAALLAHALDDLVFPGALAIIRAGGEPRLGQELRRGDLKIIMQRVGAVQVRELDDDP